MPTNDDSQFTVKNSNEIARKLHILERNKCLITVSFGGRSFITSILDVDNKKRVFIIDESSQKELNKRLADANHAFFETVMSGVRVRFSVEKISKVRFSDTFKVAMPDEIFWLERRQFYRIKTPIMNPPHCVITIETPRDGIIHTKHYTFDIYDLSLTGLCLLYEAEKNVEQEEVNRVRLDALELNSTIGCQIYIPEDDEFPAEDFSANIEIRAIFPQNANKPDKNKLIGTLFIGNKPSTESAIQRYMQHVQRENKKKSLE